jgi:ribosomal protein S18 acetylase RimI-like enzyme
VIREARAEDLEDVLQVWKEADADESVTDDPDSLARLLARDPHALLVAQEDGRLVGTLVVGWDGWRGSMYRLAVVPSMRRRGIATALVAEGERSLRELGARRISVLVISHEEAAVGFWRAIGYEHDARMHRYARTLP